MANRKQRDKNRSTNRDLMVLLVCGDAIKMGTGAWKVDGVSVKRISPAEYRQYQQVFVPLIKGK